MKKDINNNSSNSLAFGQWPLTKRSSKVYLLLVALVALLLELGDKTITYKRPNSHVAGFQYPPIFLQDFKREVGLWHSIISSVFNGMHVIFIPYALMKVRKQRLL